MDPAVPTDPHPERDPVHECSPGCVDRSHDCPYRAERVGEADLPLGTLDGPAGEGVPGIPGLEAALVYQPAASPPPLRLVPSPDAAHAAFCAASRALDELRACGSQVCAVDSEPALIRQYVATYHSGLCLLDALIAAGFAGDAVAEARVRARVLAARAPSMSDSL